MGNRISRSLWMTSAVVAGLGFILVWSNWYAIEAEYRWARILRARSAYEPSEMPWLDVAETCQAEFALLKGPGNREKLRAFVDKFGRHGPNADYRWVCSAPDATLTGVGYVSLDRANMTDATYRARILISEFLVQRFMADPTLVDRYWHVVRFSRRVVRDEDAEFHRSQLALAGLACHKRFSANRDQFWLWARDFIVLAHATGRDDLWQSVPVEEFPARFESWFSWYNQNEQLLVADEKGERFVLRSAAAGDATDASGGRGDPRPLAIPSVPFPDWTGPAPDLHSLSALP